MKQVTLLKRLSFVYILMLLAGPLGYLVRVLYANNLSVEQYGLFYSIVALVGSLGLIASVGLPQSLLYFIPKYRNNERKLRSVLVYSSIFQLIAAAIVSTILFFLAPFFADYYLKEPSASWLLRIFAVYLAVFSLGQFLQALFKGYQDEKSWAGYELIRLIPLVLLSYLAIVWFEESLLLYFSIIWLVVITLRVLIYFVILVKKIPTPTIKGSSLIPKVKSELKSYSWNVLLATGAGALLANIDVLFITTMTNLSQVGLYNIAFPTAEIGVIVLGPFLVFAQPLITDFFHHQRLENLRRIIQEIYRVALFFSLPAIVLLFNYSENIIDLLFGAQYLNADPILKILILGMLFKIFYLLGFMVLAAIGRVRERAKFVWMALAINSLLNAILIVYFEASGAAIATSVTLLFLTLVAYVELSKRIGKLFTARDIVLTTLNATMFCAILVVLKEVITMGWILEATLIALAGGAIYLLAGIYLFKLIDVSFINKILKSRYKN